MEKRKEIVNTAGLLVKGFAVALLLFLYILGSSNFQALHNLFHEHEATVLHTVNDEADPCHVAIYHQEQSDGCGHDSHLTQDDPCALCDMHLNSAHLLFNFQISPDFFSSLAEHSNIKPQAVEGYIYYTSDRAPPLA